MESRRRIDLIEHADPLARAQVAALLDEMTRPLTPRELEAELVPYYTRGKAREIVKALGFFKVVLLHAERPTPKKPSWASKGDGATAPAGE